MKLAKVFAPSLAANLALQLWLRTAGLRVKRPLTCLDIVLHLLQRLANPGKIPLEVIEVQSGAYLAEDDIVRIEDAYHRVRRKPARSSEKVQARLRRKR